MPRSAKTAGAASPPVASSSPALARPFLKWVGGKTQLLEQFKPLLPSRFSNYFEPFVGGAALFFDLRTRRSDVAAHLSDVNAELVNCYREIRDNVDAVIAVLKDHRYSSDHYYEVRSWRPEELSPHDAAARTIFLNKTGYNGLYRVNRSGQFNVPIGRFTKPLFCDPANLRACSAVLRGVSIEVGDYSSVLARAKKGDFVYFDPPYVPVSATSDFTGYVPGGFGLEEQRELSEVFSKLARKGVKVMLSNSDTDLVRRLYSNFDVQRVFASRSVNSNATRRGKLAEVVVRSWVTS